MIDDQKAARIAGAIVCATRETIGADYPHVLATACAVAIIARIGGIDAIAPKTDEEIRTYVRVSIVEGALRAADLFIQDREKWTGDKGDEEAQKAYEAVKRVALGIRPTAQLGNARRPPRGRRR